MSTRSPGMTVYLCAEHSLDTVVECWGGCEPFVEKPSRAATRGVTCDACAALATRTTRIVFVTDTPRDESSSRS